MGGSRRRGRLGDGRSGWHEESSDLGGGLYEGEELVGVGLGSRGLEIVVASSSIVRVVLEGVLVEVVGGSPFLDVTEARSQGCSAVEMTRPHVAQAVEASNASSGAKLFQGAVRLEVASDEGSRLNFDLLGGELELTSSRSERAVGLEGYDMVEGVG